MLVIMITIIKKLAKPTTQILLISLVTFSQPAVFAADFPRLSTLSQTPDLIDYRHMALYKLKLNRYYNPSSSNNPNAIPVGHTDHYNHWGWRSYPFYCSSGNHDTSFNNRMLDGLIGLLVITAITAMVATTAYSTFTALWPYLGAASLTSIELPGNSPWKITDYKTAHGSSIHYSDFNFSEDAVMNAREHGMFDRRKNPYGRFLLVDQENWWGAVDYPVDIDVSFTRFAPYSGEANEQITVNFKRKITNGLKSGTISSKIVHSTENQQEYHLVTLSDSPNWLDFSGWYHKPARLIVDFTSGGYH